MSWICEHQRNWRIALLILMAVAFMGPWSYDLINVPAKYECTASNIRLYGDFCGIPQPGIKFIFWIIGGLISISISLLSSEYALYERVRELLIILLVLLSFLSLISTLLLIIRGNKISRQVFTIIAWVFSFGGGLFLAMAHQPKMFWALWGIWFFVGLAACAVSLEILVLRENFKNFLCV